MTFFDFCYIKFYTPLSGLKNSHSFSFLKIQKTVEHLIILWYHIEYKTIWRTSVNGCTLAKIKIIVAMVIFGTIGIVVKNISLPSSAVALSRAAVGSVFLCLLMLVTGKKISFGAIKKNLVVLLLSGAFLGCNWVLLFEAYKHTSVSVATLCYYFAPIFVMVLSPILLGERLSKLRALGVALAIIGTSAVSGIFGGVGNVSARGVLFGLAAALLYAGVVMLNKRFSGMSSYEITLTQLAVSFAVLLIYTLVTKEIFAFAGVDKTSLLWLAVAGIVHTGIAYALYFGAIKSVKAQTAAILGYVDPVVAIVLSAFLLHEGLGFMEIAGAVLILGATLMCELTDK